MNSSSLYYSIYLRQFEKKKIHKTQLVNQLYQHTLSNLHLHKSPYISHLNPLSSKKNKIL